MRTARIVVAAAVIAASGLALHGARAQPEGSNASTCSGTTSAPGREVVQAIVESSRG